MTSPERPPEVSSSEVETGLKPRIKHIEDCDFPIVESDADGYKVLEIPQTLRDLFDSDEGYEAVRINSVELGRKFPGYGGQTTVGCSLFPHQDHLPSDPRRFLALSKDSSQDRGAMTYMVRPEIVRAALPDFLDYFHTHREALRESFVHNPANQVSESDLLSCYEPGGLDRLVRKKIGENPDPQIELFAYAGIINYLIDGPSADVLVEKFVEENRARVLVEEWNTDGTLIIDNSKVFRGRLGNNENALKRNWLI